MSQSHTNRTITFGSAKLFIILLTSFILSSTSFAVDLDFTNHLQTTNCQAAYQLGPCYTGNVMTYMNVGNDDGTVVDAKITAVAIGDGSYTFDYHLPNYSLALGSWPTGDVAFLYTSQSVGVGGLDLTFEFFDGTGAKAGTFLDAHVMDFILIPYDVDGEGNQSENVRADISDGLISYKVSSDLSPLTLDAVIEDGTILFTGGGSNLPESSGLSAVRLSYINTASATLHFESEAFSSGPNPVFSGVEGWGGYDPSGWGPAVLVGIPEPSTYAMLALGLCAVSVVAWRRRRQRLHKT